MSLSSVLLAKPKGEVVPSTEKPAPKLPTKEEKGSSPTPTDSSKEAAKSKVALGGVLGGNPQSVGKTPPPVKKPLTMDDFRKAFKDAAKGAAPKTPGFSDATAKAVKPGPKMDFKSTPEGGTKSPGSTGGKAETITTRVETKAGDRTPKLGERGPDARYPRTYAPSAPQAAPRTAEASGK